MTDLMIDLETIGTDPTTTVISLGACFFDLDTEKIGPTFYMALDVDEQLKKGRSLDGSTLKWWMGQSGAAKKVFNEKAKSSDEVLRTFSTWVLANCQISKVKPWGNGATFDISIMENMYKMYGIKCPWMYNSIMDLRTFRRFIANNAKVEKPVGTNHNAVDDAINQANFVIQHNKFFKEMIATFEQIKTNVDSKV